MLETAEEKADAVIAGMVSAGLAGAVIPVQLTIPFMATVAGGVVGIGRCYGTELTKDEAWKLVREFFKAAGFTYMAINAGSLFISQALYVTGLGYPAAVAMDAASSTAIAYSVGAAAKAYFSGQRSRKELGAVMRNNLREQKKQSSTVSLVEAK